MDQVSIGHGKHEDEFLIYHFLNDEIKINKFKNDKKTKVNPHLPLKLTTLVMNPRLTL
jgi:hypothetical protein